MNLRSHEDQIFQVLGLKWQVLPGAQRREFPTVMCSETPGLLINKISGAADLKQEEFTPVLTGIQDLASRKPHCEIQESKRLGRSLLRHSALRLGVTLTWAWGDI